MTTPFPFVAGQVLTAAQLNDIQNLPISDKTASYTLIAGDETKRTMMNNASATTITVNNSIFTVGDVIQVANKGAGVCTVTAGVGVTINTSGSLALAQYGGGYLLALSASTFTFFSGAAKNTLAIDFLVVGGGASGGRTGGGGGAGGGGAGGFVTGTSILGKTSYTIKIGAGGAAQTSSNIGYNGFASGFINSANGGGAGGYGVATGFGRDGASGGGGGNVSAGSGLSGEGNNGGALSATGEGGGGGGGAGSVGSAGVTNVGGAGGSASTNNYTGSTISYSGGGGGSGVSTGGTGGTNAGNGGSNGAGTNATANRGGGGGGGTAGNSGAGGSGQVVLRYLTTDATGLTITTTGSPTTGTSGAYSFIQYTATGTLVIA